MASVQQAVDVLLLARALSLAGEANRGAALVDRLARWLKPLTDPRLAATRVPRDAREAVMTRQAALVAARSLRALYDAEHLDDPKTWSEPLAVFWTAVPRLAVLAGERGPDDDGDRSPMQRWRSDREPPLAVVAPLLPWLLVATTGGDVAGTAVGVRVLVRPSDRGAVWLIESRGPAAASERVQVELAGALAHALAAVAVPGGSLTLPFEQAVWLAIEDGTRRPLRRGRVVERDAARFTLAVAGAGAIDADANVDPPADRPPVVEPPAPSPSPSLNDLPPPLPLPPEPWSEEEREQLGDALADARTYVDKAIADLQVGAAGGALAEPVRALALWHFRTDAEEDLKHIVETYRLVVRRLRAGPRLYFRMPLGLKVLSTVAETAFGDAPVWLGPLFFLSPPQTRAAIIIHELTHNAGKVASADGVLDHEIYRISDEYKRASRAEAMANAEHYAHFAVDDARNPDPGDPTARDPQLALSGQAAAGAAFGLDLATIQPRVVVTAQLTGAVTGPELRVVDPLLGLEMRYFPRTGETQHRVLAGLTLGGRIGPPGQAFYVDVRTGGFVGAELPGGAVVGGVIAHLAAHLWHKGFDLAAFLEAHVDLFDGVGNATIVGFSVGRL